MEEEHAPKETTIARDVFGKADFDPSESTLVRVYAYNLRKKLAAYYTHEGREDQQRLRIPKGGYRVVIEDSPPATAPPAAPPQTVKPASHRMSWIIALVAGLFIGLLVHLIINPQPERNPFFAGIATSERPAMLVVGDLFLFAEYDSLTKSTRTIRKPQINTAEQFAALPQEYTRPHTELTPRGYTFLNYNAAKWVRAVSDIFSAYDKDFAIRRRTKLTTEELRNNDFIVVGMTKTIGPFRAFFTGSRFDYLDYDVFRYVDDNGQEHQFEPTGTSSAYHTDYGLIARFPGPTGNTVQLFTGFWDSATTHSLDLLTRDDFRETLRRAMEEKWGEVPEYYEIFYRLNGIEQTELDYELLYLHRLDPEAVDW